jgi:hypothetical protein
MLQIISAFACLTTTAGGRCKPCTSAGWCHQHMFTDAATLYCLCLPCIYRRWALQPPSLMLQHITAFLCLVSTAGGRCKHYTLAGGCHHLISLRMLSLPLLALYQPQVGAASPVHQLAGAGQPRQGPCHCRIPGTAGVLRPRAADAAGTAEPCWRG